MYPDENDILLKESISAINNCKNLIQLQYTYAAGCDIFIAEKDKRYIEKLAAARDQREKELNKKQTKD